MTKNEAKVAMQSGKKVRHRFFTDDEHITMNKAGKIVSDEGYEWDEQEFFSYITSKAWDTDWEIVQ